MIPTEDFDSHKKIDDLKASGLKVDHVDMYFNPGHSAIGLAKPSRAAVAAATPSQQRPPFPP